MLNLLNLSHKILQDVCEMGSQIEGNKAPQSLIFPSRYTKDGETARISEQELRQLFIKEFTQNYPELFYSIETPTQYKYRFGKEIEDIVSTPSGQSAMVDMSVYSYSETGYNLFQNIEFKKGNPELGHIAKDILKLCKEPKNGAFLTLLENSNRGTLCNKSETGILDKLRRSFDYFKDEWNNDLKEIEIVVFSLKQQTLLYRTITKADLNNLSFIFFYQSDFRNIIEIEGNGWEKRSL